MLFMSREREETQFYVNMPGVPELHKKLVTRISEWEDNSSTFKDEEGHQFNLSSDDLIPGSRMEDVQKLLNKSDDL
ncbi:MAG: hypothetical protein JWN30_602 [Bacilli bacterium]|nr:hypothetical protein [Bacilli bacterium]